MKMFYLNLPVIMVTIKGCYSIAPKTIYQGAFEFSPGRYTGKIKKKRMKSLICIVGYVTKNLNQLIIKAV